MSCDWVREELALFIYDELSPEGRVKIEDHLEACDACRAEFEREKSMHSLVDEREIAPPPGLLARCRRDLAERVHDLEAPVPARGKLWRRMKGLMPSLAGLGAGLLKPAGAVALVAVGFFGARYTQTTTPGSTLPSFPPLTSSSFNSETPTTRIRSIEPATDGKLQIRVEEVREKTVKANLDDQDVRRLLLDTARGSADAGLRVESVELLTSAPGADDVRNLLMQALQTDPNPGVRLKAMEGLKPYAGDPSVRKTLKEVLLKDANPGMRIQAIDLLIQHKEDRMVPVLQELLRKEDNNYVRMKCQNALRDMKASTEIF